MNTKKIFNSKVLLFLPIFLIIASLIAFAFYYYQKYQTVKNNPEIVVQEETKSVITAISNFMDLPSDEEPTLATVTDQEKLKDQDFFKNALNGDKVLIYTKARKAILYRPSTKRIIEFAPLTFGEQDQAVVNDSQHEPIKVVIYNGTKIVGLSAKYEGKLTEISNLIVTAKTNAAKDDYTESMVIDLSGNNQKATDQIARVVNGEVVTELPAGESKPEADILIIIGE